MVLVETGVDELRQKTLETAKRHKASWIALGQYLYTIHREKLYKKWGFLAFETYCKKELSLKATTAAKLLKSYSFLEKEEPRLADGNFEGDASAKAVPDYESVNLLRLAKDNKNLTPEDFADLRHDVINEGREPKEVRAQVKKLLSERDFKDPAEVRRSRRNAAIKRLIATLARTKTEMESDHLLPAYLLKQMAGLSQKLEDQLE